MYIHVYKQHMCTISYPQKFTCLVNYTHMALNLLLVCTTDVVTDIYIVTDNGIVIIVTIVNGTYGH